VKLKQRLFDEMQLWLADRVKGRMLQSDGSYVRLEPEPGGLAVSSQDALMALARGHGTGLEVKPLPTSASEPSTPPT